MEASQEQPEPGFYCPGCGLRHFYRRLCLGKGEAPHPPIEVVPTDELKDAPDPQQDPDGFRQWQQKHTPAPGS